jgi:hypothetical protein
LPQAARIAQLCRSSGITHPLELLLPLLEDEDARKYIATAGNARHRQSGKGPMDENFDIVELDSEGIVSVIQADYRWAEMLSEVPGDILDEILTLYPVFMERLGKAKTFNDAEKWYGDRVNSLLSRYFGEERYEALNEWANASETP